MSVAGILASNLFSNALSHTVPSSPTTLSRMGSASNLNSSADTASFFDQLQGQSTTQTSGASSPTQGSHFNGVQPILNTRSTNPGHSSFSLTQNQSTQSAGGNSVNAQLQAMQAYSSLQQNPMNSFLGNWIDSANSISLNA